ncbi:MAG: hypothetical protein GXN96_06920 [Aquificae bacterium]|nr:hypothetical protein [Aquificota bacterium]
MKGEALIFMLLSWILICSLSTFCFTMLLTSPQRGEGKQEGEKEEDLPEEIT